MRSGFPGWDDWVFASYQHKIANGHTNFNLYNLAIRHPNHCPIRDRNPIRHTDDPADPANPYRRSSKLHHSRNVAVRSAGSRYPLPPFSA